MSVIKCPHCKKHISSTLSTCPECGLPVPPEVVEPEIQTPEPESVAPETPEPSTAAPEACEPITEDSEAVEPVTEAPASVETEAPVDNEQEAAPAEDPQTVMPAEDTAAAEVSPETQKAEPDTEDSAESDDVKEDVVAAPAVQPKAKKAITPRKVILALIFLVLCVGVGYFFYVDSRRDAQREQREFERLTNCTDLLRYEDFLVRFPNSEHVAEVQKMYEKAKKEQLDFFMKTSSGGREALEAFIKTHPSSPYVKVCQNRIDSLDWNEALTTHTTASYAHYLSLHPEGIFQAVASEAKSRLQKLEVTYEERSMIRGALDMFLSAMTSCDVARVDALVTTPLTFCGEGESSGNSVVSFYTANFHHDDVLGVHFTLPESFSIKKTPASAQGTYNYDISASVEATLNRSGVDSLNTQRWSMQAKLTPERKIKSVNLQRQQ